MGQTLAVTVSENIAGTTPLPIFHSKYANVPVALTSKPEFFLLLTIARVKLPAHGQSLLRELLAQPLDWEYLLTMAAQHGLEPLLLHHLHNNTDGIVPQEVVQTLRVNCKAIALRNLVLSATLREISAYLTSLQIEQDRKSVV